MDLGRINCLRVHLFQYLWNRLCWYADAYIRTHIFARIFARASALMVAEDILLLRRICGDLFVSYLSFYLIRHTNSELVADVEHARDEAIRANSHKITFIAKMRFFAISRFAYSRAQSRSSHTACWSLRLHRHFIAHRVELSTSRASSCDQFFSKHAESSHRESPRLFSVSASALGLCQR